MLKMALDNGATAVIDEVIDQSPDDVIEAPKLMDDTIRDTLRDLQSKGAVIEDSPSSKETPATSEEKAQRIRDEQGKFTPTGKQEVPLVPVTPAEVPADTAAVAPNTWKKEAAATWASLPPAAKTEIARREADFHKGIEGYKQAAGFGQAMERAMTPYAQTIQSLGLTADKAVGELMAADHTLRYAPQAQKNAFFAELAHRYGIDMPGATEAHQNINPQVMELQQRTMRAEQQLQQFQQSGERQQNDALNSEINAFANDPAHSHFPAVVGHVQALLQAGQATGLEDAYEQAVWANPTTRGLLLAEQQATARTEADQKAKAARQSSSVNTRTRTAMPTGQPIGSMEDSIRDTYRRLTNA